VFLQQYKLAVKRYFNIEENIVTFIYVCRWQLLIKVSVMCLKKHTKTNNPKRRWNVSYEFAKADAKGWKKTKVGREEINRDMKTWDGFNTAGKIYIPRKKIWESKCKYRVSV
jgi:hypothetical protein